MSGRRIRVLQVIGALNRGGAEMVVVNLCNAIDRAGFHLRICSLADSVPMATRLDRPDEVKVITCGRLPGLPRLGNTARVIQRLHGVVRDFRPHVIHSHLYSLNAPLQWLAGIPAHCGNVVTLHIAGLYYTRAGHWPSAVFRWCEQANMRLCGARVVAVSRAVADMARGWLHVPAGMLQVIYNGIDTDTFGSRARAAATRRSLGLSAEDLLVIQVARFHEQKGHKHLLAAWPRVVAEVPAARLLLVGDGPLRAEMQALAASLGVADTVRFLGLRDDVPALLACSDVGVFPSLFEGLPIAVVEMMSMQLPVVVSEIQALREATDPPNAGLAVPPAEPGPLAEAIVRLLRSPDLRRRIAENAALSSCFPSNVRRPSMSGSTRPWHGATCGTMEGDAYDQTPGEFGWHPGRKQCRRCPSGQRVHPQLEPPG
jgi:glycosyltransferase involved in cell wall biosynthesis